MLYDHLPVYLKQRLFFSVLNPRDKSPQSRWRQNKEVTFKGEIIKSLVKFNCIMTTIHSNVSKTVNDKKKCLVFITSKNLFVGG